MSASVIYLGNTHEIELSALQAPDDSYINDATVAVTITDAAGAEIAGQSWPLALDYVADSEGTYTAAIPHDVTLTRGAPYTATITVDADTDGNAQFEVPLVAGVRTQ